MKLKLSKKGINAMGMVVAIVLVATSLVIGIWIVGSFRQAVQLPIYRSSEELTFTNNTALGVSGNRLVTFIDIVENTTQPINASNAPEVACWPSGTGSTITCIFNASYPTRDWNVSYRYNLADANTTLGTVMSTTWSSFQLGVVVLIVIAAVAIIGILVAGMGGAAGGAA